MESTLFKIHFACSWFMTGLIWLIQIVHYPLFNKVGVAEFPLYHALHSKLISFIVMPVMIFELLSLAVLIMGFDDFHLLDKIIISSSLFIIWATTFFFSVPAHNELANGFSEAQYQKLVWTNWFRTFFWTLKSLYLFKFLS